MGKLQFESSSPQADLQSYFTRRLSPLCEDSSVIEQLYSEQLKSLEDIISRCVLNFESNSVLVMGPRGSGKSILMKTALERLSKKNNAKGNYSVVKLFGSGHTDDRIALKDITLQLQLENVVGDRVFGSFAENLQFLLDSLKSGADRSKAKSSIFILDDFELFTQHRNQTLLYNLFDVAQSRQAPIAVIGLCCRLDVVELLEKRVKSRFAHRFLYLMNSIKEEEYISVAETLLTIDPTIYPGGVESKKFASKWNQDLKRDVMPKLRDSLIKLYHIDRILRTLVNCLQPMVRQIDDTLQVQPTVFRDTVNRIYEDDPKLVVISRMPALHIILLVCMLRLNVIYDGEPFNFELLYKEFKRFNRETRSLLNLPKDTVLKAFESICELEFVQPVGGIAMASQKRYHLHHLHFNADLVRKAVESHSGLPTDVSQWVTTTLSDRSLGI
ncbi:origin recognition complex subunit 4-like isoform X2 [Varroa jacobsoni]|uniref:Origin recognition complex subunit 4 n=1 Tax=Varroa destructor TaxID=109461 RepID=A0A7M7M7K4_VARDE|nr:origin recognition complex subunit 4-like [Varroa destructor]XP_022711518.1 origin recognition complex subunit 4-like isoform X1 [Varroa jacobsoni]XP_022711519.1 origin recognition complex subunit 4-like isoform X2 [Varroa jacobsoni]